MHVGKKTKLFLVFCFLGSLVFGSGAVAQPIVSGTVNILGVYTSANVLTKVGDSTNNAIRMNCVTGCAGSSFADNSAFTFGTTTVSIGAGVLDDIAPNAATENSAAAFRISTNRNLYTQIRDGTGAERGAVVTAANALKVDGSAVTQPVSGTVTANVGTTGGLALDATLSSVQPRRLQDGVGATLATVTAGNALKVDGSAVTQPISGTVTANQGGAWTLSANQSVNVAQINGVTPLMGNGITGTGSQRVTIASDNTAFAVNNTQQGTAAQNVTQFGGANISTGTGAGGVGIPRVTISNDSSLAANQSVNVAQINAVTPLMGNGVTGTGSPRITIASDNSNSAGLGGSATGSAVPSAARYIGGQGSGNLIGLTVCDTVKTISVTANTQLVTGTAAKHIYICSINLVVAAATNVALVSGTGAVCATGIGAVAGGTTAATGWNLAANGGLTQGTGVGWVMRTAATGDNLCILVSAANQTSGVITYTVQ